MALLSLCGFCTLLVLTAAVAPIPGSMLTGTLLPDGFIRYLAWPRLLQEPESLYTQWCASRKVGDDTTILVAFRTNRCISTTLGPGSGIVTMVNAPGSPTQLFMFAQANSSHFDLAMCPTDTCDSGCTHDLNPTPGCFPSSFTATGVPGTDVGVVVSPSWTAEAPVLPSPLYCFRIMSDVNCQGGELLVSGCVAQCTPIGNNSFTFVSCVPGSNAVALSTCPYDPLDGHSVAFAYTACLAATPNNPCSGPALDTIPGTNGACTPIRGGRYGFQTASCTVTNDNVLHVHPCAGLSDVTGVRCSATDDQDVSVDGTVANAIDGSWVSAGTRLQVRELHPGTIPFSMRGDWSPNQGALQLSYASKNNIALGTPMVLATFSSVVANRAFSSVSVVASDSTDQFCATTDFQPTSMSVLVSQGQCSTTLSVGAIAGIAVGAAVLVAVIVVATVGGIMQYRKNQRIAFVLSSPRTEYTKM